jgi:phage terminase small subunit
VLRNIRHERFAQGIAQGKPATHAYIQAGYKARGNSAEVNASRLLRNAQVQHRIAELAEETRQQAIANAEELQRILTSIAREQATEEQLTRSGDVAVLKVGARDRIKAIELLGRARGVWSPVAADTGELDAIAEALQRARAVN